MRSVWIITLVVAVAIILAIGLSLGFVYKNKKAKSVTDTNEIIWSFHLDNDSDLKIKGTLEDVINVDILKKEGYSVGGNNASVNSITHDFPGTKLTGWTHTYQHPLRIRKFIVGSNEVGFSKLFPISGFTVFNTQDLGDFVTIWHDGDFHHYSTTGDLLSKGAFPFANGDNSIHPKGLKIPTRISEDLGVDFNPVHGFPSGWHDRDVVEPQSKPLLNGLYPDVLTTGWSRDDLDVEQPNELEFESVSFNTIHGFPSGWHDNSEIVELDNEPILNGLYPDHLTTGCARDELDISQKRKTVYTDFDPSIGFPSGWHDKSDIVELDTEPILNGLYPDTIRTGWARDDLDVETVDNTVTFVNVLPQSLNLTNEDVVFDLSVITLATETTPYKIIQGNDEMLIKKHKIDEVFNKYSCSLTNERKFKPHIRHLLSNFELLVDDVSEFELYAGEFDEPLLIRLKNPSGWTTYIRDRDNKWEVGYVPYLDINVLDKHYLNLRDDITMIDCSKKSGSYVFGKYKIVVTDPDPNDMGQLAGYKTYIHTIYHDSSNSNDFAAVKVHRFKYQNSTLKGFIRYHSVRKVYVHFWEHELTKPIYIRTSAEHGFGNYFGYPNYTMQTDVSLYPYFLKLTNFEVNDALVINLARLQNYDFEGGVSPHLTRHLVTVTFHDNSPMQRFRRYVHTLTVGGVNKPFNVLRFVNELNLTADLIKVSSVETFFYYKQLKKPLLFIMNGSSKQSFYKLENDNYVKMDNLIVNLETTLKYLAYINFNYVSIDISKSSDYHYTGAPNPALLPDSTKLVSVVKEEFKEFTKFTHSIKADNKVSKFKLIGLEGVNINFDDPEISRVDCYFFNEHKDTPIAVVLKGTTDLIYAIKKSHPIKKDSTFLSSLNDSLRNLVQFNFGLLYLSLDKTAKYYSKQDYGFEIEVSQDGSVGNYTKYVHTFPSFSDVCFVVRDDYYHTKIEPQGSFKSAIVFKNRNGFPEIVTLLDVKSLPRHFIYQDNIYKRAKPESVDKKLGIAGSQQQAQENSRS